MNTMVSPARSVVAVGLALLSLVVAVGVFLAVGPRTPLPPKARPVVATHPVPAPSSVAAHLGCWMLCNEPPLPTPDVHGCRLFCDAQRPDNERNDR
jgi:hypothetical protein